MSKTIQYGELQFEPYIDEKTIREAVARVAGQLNHDYEGTVPLFVVVMNGAIMFTADLLRQLNIECTISCCKLSSYCGGTQSTGHVRELIGLTEDLTGRDVIILEDIVDTGRTMHGLIPKLRDLGAKSVEVCTFLFKPDSLQFEDARPKYVAIPIPNQFIIGYGLDIEEEARNLSEVYTLCTK